MRVREPGPTENEQSRDWLSEFVWEYLVGLIESPLEQHREAAEESQARDLENHATAAAARLVDCTSKKTHSPYRTFNADFHGAAAVTL